MEQFEFEVPDWNPAAVLGVPVPKSNTGTAVENPLFMEYTTPIDKKTAQLPKFSFKETKDVGAGKGFPLDKTVKLAKEKDIEDTGDTKQKPFITEILEQDVTVGQSIVQELVKRYPQLVKRYPQKTEQQTVDEINSKIEDEIEVVKPEYVDPRFVDNISRKPMYRLQQGKFRHYFTFTNPADVQGMQGQVYRPVDFVKFYPSVTTIIGYRQPESEFLLEMISKMGLVEFRKWFGLTAKFGTLDHILSLEHLASGVTADKRYLNFDLIPQRVEDYIAKHKLDVNHYTWTEKIQQDMLAFRQFYIDYNVVPLAIEALGYWDDGIHRFGGALDIICEMDYTEKGFFGEIYKSGTNKGQPKESKQTKRITAIIDLKSGRNGFRDEHKEQLVMYDMIAEKCFGIKVDRLYNVAPKDWKTSPDYHLKDQTDGRTLGKIPHLLGLFFDDYKGPKDIKLISGSLTGTQDFSEVCRKVNAHDFIFQKMYNKQNNQNSLKSN